jgi:hypothetical protein
VTPYPPILEFVDKHYLLVASSAVGLVVATRKVGSCLVGATLAGLRRFPKLHRAFYECRAECAENRRRFQQATKVR